MDVFNRHPELKKLFEENFKTKPYEILTDMLQTDKVYAELCRNRADKSMDLKKLLTDTAADTMFEAYSDAVYAQEVYELDCIYRQAFSDALKILKELA